MIKYILPIVSVLLGVLIASLSKNKKTINTKLLLSFSGSFLLALTLFELLPDVYEHLDAKLTGLFIMGGILLQIILEYFSKGAEHGHIHVHKDEKAFPWLLFISLCIHSFLEGFAINDHNDIVYGILIHNIPIATLISMFLLQSHYSKPQIAGFLIVFAFITPLGTFISSYFDFISDYIHIINAFVIGIFFHISTTILFESSEGHKFNLSKLIALILGIGMAYLM
jgi:zinc transporter ZupT